MAEKKSTVKDERIRNWTFVIYPTYGVPPAPSNWRDLLDDLHIQWLESPLHDKDINADGVLKKAHIHILLIFEGKKSYDQIKEITDLLNAPIPQKVASVKGLVRYFIHMDNPEKFQYEKSLIIAHGGADVAELLKPTSSSRYVIIREMITYVKKNNLTEMCDLVEYAMSEHFDDWFPLLCDNSAYIMSSVIKSRRHKSSEKTLKINFSTGELLD